MGLPEASLAPVLTFEHVQVFDSFTDLLRLQLMDMLDIEALMNQLPDVGIDFSEASRD